MPRACPEDAQAETRPVEDPRIPSAATRLKERVPAMDATIASGLQAITPRASIFSKCLWMDRIDPPEDVYIPASGSLISSSESPASLIAC